MGSGVIRHRDNYINFHQTFGAGITVLGGLTVSGGISFPTGVFSHKIYTGSGILTSFDVEAGMTYGADTVTAALTAKLEANPNVGDTFCIRDVGLSWDSNALTLDAQGNNIQSSGASVAIEMAGATVVGVYVDAARGWILFVY